MLGDHRTASVAACSQAGIGYTYRPFSIAGLPLRLARRLGSDTLSRMLSRSRPCSCCGLLAGWDRIHLLGDAVSSALLRLARRLGSDTLSDAAWHASCRMLRLARRLGSDTLEIDSTNRDIPSLRLARRLGSDTLCQRREKLAGCGLLAGWDRIHYDKVATHGSAMLRLARRLGSDTLSSPRHVPPALLRLARRLGSDTLIPRWHDSYVAACSQAGIGYTSTAKQAYPASCGLLAGWDRIHSQRHDHVLMALLRLARRLGSDTLYPCLTLCRERR